MSPNHPKKKPKISKDNDKEKTAIPSDAKWCLDRADHLSFKEFIERWDCLDRNRAQQRFGNILAKYFGTKSERDRKIYSDYKSWIATADYLRFWTKRSESIILAKTNMACTEMIDAVNDQRLASLHSAVANSDSASNSQTYTSTSSASAFDTPATPSVPNLSHTSTASGIPHPQKSSCTDPNDSEGDGSFDVDNSCITISNDAGNDDDMWDDPWIFQDTDVTQLFKSYRAAIRDIVLKHKTLPVESYIHELAALTHVLILCKNQHSAIAEKIFSLNLLKDLATSLTSETVNSNLDFPHVDYMAITTSITNLSLSSLTTSREEVILEFTIMSSRMSYGPKRILRGITNLIQKLPNEPLKDYKEISESELWSTYFDPILSCLISDPEKLVHLRWTNTIPHEKGTTRPDAVISEKPQLEFGSSVGYGEAKIHQGNGSKHALCMDTLRLAIFGKNAIDVNKLDAALAFQIHGFNITFYMIRLTAKGIYAFFEIAHLRFPQSLEDLPSFIALANFKKLLAINDAFWRFCRKSAKPDVIEARYYETLMALDAVIDASQDSGRSCVLRFGH